MYPKRFYTGIRNTTIPNPAILHQGDVGAKVFEGQVEDYDFRFQRRNFSKLQAVLLANGTSMGPIAAAEFTGYYGYEYAQKPMRQVCFVACARDGSLMWWKYAANSSAGNQNEVFVGGKKMHLSTFLSLPDNKQRALLGGNPSIMAVAGV
jgi:hypothetical protein